MEACQKNNLHKKYLKTVKILKIYKIQHLHAYILHTQLKHGSSVNAYYGTLSS